MRNLYDIILLTVNEFQLVKEFGIRNYTALCSVKYLYSNYYSTVVYFHIESVALLIRGYIIFIISTLAQQSGFTRGIMSVCMFIIYVHRVTDRL